MQSISVLLPSGSSSISIGSEHPLVLFAGPCVIESREQTIMHAEKLSQIASDVGIPLIFKSSYDKANRTSVKSFRGVGLEAGLEILAEVREQLNLPVITDVHSVEEAMKVARVVDVLQIPAFLCRQTDLLLAAGETTRPVMIKKGQFMAPEDMQYVAEKISSTSNNNIIFCERGSSFGYRELIVDFRSLSAMAELGHPVVFDATHSVQIMGGGQGKSSGKRAYIPLLTRAAAAAGVNGVFLECHENPELAPSDGANMLEISKLRPLLEDLVALDRISLNTRP